MFNIRDVLAIVLKVLWGQAAEQFGGHAHNVLSVGYPLCGPLDRIEHVTLYEYLVGLGVEHESRAHIALMTRAANALEHVEPFLGVLASPSMATGRRLVNISVNTAFQNLALPSMLSQYAWVTSASTSRGGAVPRVAPIGWVRLEGGYTIRWRRGDRMAYVLNEERAGDHETAGVVDTIPVSPSGWADLAEIRMVGQRWRRDLGHRSI
ncbi:MAG: hypothetical protein ACRDTE_25320 [Pseudonocardiaceae bacterium]